MEDLALQRDLLFGRDTELSSVEINEGGQPNKDQRENSSIKFSSLADVAICTRSVTEQGLTKVSVKQETWIKLRLVCKNPTKDI